MKFIHTSDWHLGAAFSVLPPALASKRREEHHRAISEIIDCAITSKVDLFLIAGDLFNSQNPSTGDIAFVQNLLTKLKNEKIAVFIIPGNHETNSQMNSLKEKFVHNIHQKSFNLGSILFIGCGGSTFTPFNTPFEMSEKEFEKAISKLKTQDHRLKILLLTHEPPYGTKLDYLGEHEGSKSIRKFIDKHQPDYNICGHFHENEGLKDKIGRTIVINPGPKGKIIEL